MTRVVGHRGAAAIAPENTLAAFRAGIAVGADVIECDVHRTRDGHLVLLHDANVAHTTDGRGTVGELTLEEVRSLNASARFRPSFPNQQIPLLADLLELVAEQAQVRVQIELKASDNGPYAGLEEQVITELAHYGLEQTAELISFDPASVQRLRSLAPHLLLGYLASRQSVPLSLRHAPRALVGRARDLGADFLGLDHRMFDQAYLDAVQANGIKIAVWTVNAADEMQYLVKAGVWAITTDCPDVLRRIVDSQR